MLHDVDTEINVDTKKNESVGLSKYSITPRDRTFNFSSAGTAWLNQDAYLTHMFNTSSLLLPYVEGLVNYAVYQVSDRIQQKELQIACSQFIKQESNHTREHLKYNQALRVHGYSHDAVLKKFKSNLKTIKHAGSPLTVLAVAVGFECFTAIICHIVLDQGLLKTSETNMRAFWEWHMQEELEHKAVLMDLYKEAGGGYFRRISVLAVVLIGYCYYALKIYLRFLRVNKLSIFKGLLVACGRKSFFRKSLVASLHCFRIGYHPNEFVSGNSLH